MSNKNWQLSVEICKVQRDLNLARAQVNADPYNPDHKKEVLNLEDQRSELQKKIVFECTGRAV